MNLTNLSKGAWLDFSASWRSKGGDRLELWLPRNWPAEDSELRWRRIAAGGAVREGVQRGLEGLAPAEEITVWTPAAETLFLRARLPTRSAAKIVQALPFALEEQLIDPPERLHFAFAHEADGALAVAVTRRERMESWLAALAAAGLAPTQLAPVTLSVPLAERAWTLAFVDGEIVLRSKISPSTNASVQARSASGTDKVTGASCVGARPAAASAASQLSMRSRRVTATASAPSGSCAKAKCSRSGGSISCSSSAKGSA